MQIDKNRILEIAKRNGGIFTVDRNSYRAYKLRNKLRKMAKDKKKYPLKFYKATQKQLTYIIEN